VRYIALLLHYVGEVFLTTSIHLWQPGGCFPLEKMEGEEDTGEAKVILDQKYF
jgi:hypothetical protein